MAQVNRIAALELADKHLPGSALLTSIEHRVDEHARARCRRGCPRSRDLGLINMRVRPLTT